MGSRIFHGTASPQHPNPLNSFEAHSACTVAGDIFKARIAAVWGLPSAVQVVQSVYGCRVTRHHTFRRTSASSGEAQHSNVINK
jgi:hypothetical protein